jgi:hypothetical protein
MRCTHITLPPGSPGPCVAPTSHSCEYHLSHALHPHHTFKSITAPCVAPTSHTCEYLLSHALHPHHTSKSITGPCVAPTSHFHKYYLGHLLHRITLPPASPRPFVAPTSHLHQASHCPYPTMVLLFKHCKAQNSSTMPEVPCSLSPAPPQSLYLPDHGTAFKYWAVVQSTVLKRQA